MYALTIQDQHPSLELHTNITIREWWPEKSTPLLEVHGAMPRFNETDCRAIYEFTSFSKNGAPLTQSYLSHHPIARAHRRLK